jgi:hypothetical protein
MRYKPDWNAVKDRHIAWWARKGLVVSIGAPRDVPAENVPQPAPLADIALRWTDPDYRAAAGLCQAAGRFFGGDAVPMVELMLGPGSLSTFLGATPEFAPSTVWYQPCIVEADSHGPLRFDPQHNHWWDVHVAMARQAAQLAQGRCMVSMPDLIENIDTLASLRGTQELVMDLLERPEWVARSVREINQAFFAAFDGLLAIVGDGEGGNCYPAFGLWGPGRTAKVQCDFSCMISTAMFEEFVVPSLREQCEWLDYSMYHLDGTNATHHLDSLLAIDTLDAIEWTPQAGLPGGGSPRWYELYRYIRRGGKSVQAVEVAPHEVLPLIEAVGPEGLYVMTSAPTQQAAQRLHDDVRRHFG